MKLYLSESTYFETNKPLDISISLVAGDENVRAWYVDPPRMEPVKANGFNGSVMDGGAVNFRNIFFNPHGHGTHTECLGHITKEVYSVNQVLKTFICKAQLLTIEPKVVFNDEFSEEDELITLAQLEKIKWENGIEAIIIRTLPNLNQKKHIDYSSSNPPYLSIECLEIINKIGIKHLLIDLPSVDRESDAGKLIFHHGYWGVPDNPNHERTITELIYVDNSITDGLYILELQMAAFENDASPSRPVLYKMEIE
jgi:kynurenine formamidase